MSESDAMIAMQDVAGTLVARHGAIQLILGFVLAGGVACGKPEATIVDAAVDAVADVAVDGPSERRFSQVAYLKASNTGTQDWLAYGLAGAVYIFARMGTTWGAAVVSKGFRHTGE